MNRAVADCFAHQCHLIYSSSSAQCVWAQTGTTGISPLIKTSFSALYCRALVIHCCRFTASASYSPPLRWKAFHMFFFFFSASTNIGFSVWYTFMQSVCVKDPPNFYLPCPFVFCFFVGGARQSSIHSKMKLKWMKRFNTDISLPLLPYNSPQTFMINGWILVTLKITLHVLNHQVKRWLHYDQVPAKLMTLPSDWWWWWSDC